MIHWDKIDWQGVSALIGVVMAMIGVAWAAMRQALGRSFVTRGDHAELGGRMGRVEGRVEKVERQMETLPTGAEINALTDRVARVETGIGVIGAEMRGTHEAVKRVEHMTDLILRDRLGEKA